jgi:hypothetical protein
LWRSTQGGGTGEAARVEASDRLLRHSTCPTGRTAVRRSRAAKVQSTKPVSARRVCAPQQVCGLRRVCAPQQACGLRRVCARQQSSPRLPRHFRPKSLQAPPARSSARQQMSPNSRREPCHKTCGQQCRFHYSFLLFRYASVRSGGWNVWLNIRLATHNALGRQSQIAVGSIPNLPRPRVFGKRVGLVS